MPERKFIVREKTSGSYYDGNAGFHSDLYEAKIFDEKDAEKFSYHGNEIIFLDSEKGLELLTEEILSLNTQIPQMESRLDKMRRGAVKLFNSNSEMISEYAKRYSRWNNGITGMNESSRKEIVKQIVNSK